MAAGSNPAPAVATVLPGGRDAVCRAVHGWLGLDAETLGARMLVVTGPRGAGKTFTLAWVASVLDALADRAALADDARDRFAWISACGLTPRVAAWGLAEQIGVTAKGPGQLVDAVREYLRADRDRDDVGGFRIPMQSRGSFSSSVAFASARSAGSADAGPSKAEQIEDEAGRLLDELRGKSPDESQEGVSPASAEYKKPAAAPSAELVLSGRSRRRVTVLISEIDQSGHMRDGSSRQAFLDDLIAPLITIPGIRLIVETAAPGLPGQGGSTVIDLADPRWTDRAGFASWLDGLVASGGAAAPQAYPNPLKAREILSLAQTRHIGLAPSTDERPWKLAAVPFDIAFREGIADQIMLEPANLVLAQQPALSIAIDALGLAVAPGTRAAWRIAGQALTSDLDIPMRAAVLHGAALAVGDDALAAAVAPYTAGVRPSDGKILGDATGWLTRWAGWRPLPPDSPRATPWPGPVAALALLPTGPAAGSGSGLASASAVAGESQDADAAQPDAAQPDAVVPDAVESDASSAAPAPEAPGMVLVAVDDLTRSHTIAPSHGRIVGRPERAVMVKTRALTVVGIDDTAASVIYSDASGSLATLGPRAPREAVAEIREVLESTACAPISAVGVADDAFTFGDADGRVHVWSLERRDSLAAPATRHEGPVTAVAAIWMPETDILFTLSGGQDGMFRLWAVPADPGPTPVENRAVPVTAITAAVTAAAGPIAAVAWADGVVTLWDLGEARTTSPIPLGWAPTAMTLGADGLLVVAGDDGLMAIELDLEGMFGEY